MIMQWTTRPANPFLGCRNLRVPNGTLFIALFPPSIRESIPKPIKVCISETGLPKSYSMRFGNTQRAKIFAEYVSYYHITYQIIKKKLIKNKVISVQ